MRASLGLLLGSLPELLRVQEAAESESCQSSEMNYLELLTRSLHMMDYGADQTHRALEQSHVDERTIFTIIWVALLVAFLIGPCCVKRRRKTCLRRIRERRFHVEAEEETEEQWFIVAMERYRASAAQVSEAQSAANRSNEDGIRRRRKLESEECRRILLERLSKFAMILKKEQLIEGGTDDSFFGDGNEKEQRKEAATSEKDEGIGEFSGEGDIEAGMANESNSNDQDQTDDEVGKAEKTSQTASTYRKVLLPRPGVPVSDNTRTLAANPEVPMVESDGTQSEETGRDADEHGCGVVVDMNQYREVGNGCAVCLESLVESERVCWSSNADCPHVFHEHCIVDWLVALGRRKRRRRESEEEETDRGVADFPMLCPCCRQDFIDVPGV